MVYSTVHHTNNSAEISEESESLSKFAYNKARTHFWERLGGAVDDPAPFAGMVHGACVIGTPLVYLYYLATGPFLYKAEDSPEQRKEKVSEIEKISSEESKK